MRAFLRWTLLTVAAVASGTSLGQAQSLISQSTASRYGLTRAWYAQIGSPRVNGPLAHVSYDEGMLLVQSKRGLLTALDAETGRTLWSTQVGPRDRSSSEPAANHKYVAIVSGSTLYVVSRADGGILWRRQIRGAPGAGPGITATHVFVPIITGLVEGYDLEKGAKQTPWNFQSTGRVLTPPMTTDLTVSWTTERGYFYVADPAGGGIRYRLETRDEIHARPASWSPHLFACSSDGYVYALNEENGSFSWKFSAGEAIYEPPVAIEGRVFVVTEFAGMYCLDAGDGSPLWHAPGVKQFVATSPSRVYVSDRLNHLAILDLNRGVRLGTMPTSRVTTKLVNRRSDRIFLVDGSNVIQCLHEIPLKSPVMYTPPPLPEKPQVKLKPRDRTAPQEPPTDFGDEPPPDEPAEEPPADDPFETKMPEEPADETENPFDP